MPLPALPDPRPYHVPGTPIKRILLAHGLALPAQVDKLSDLLAATLQARMRSTVMVCPTLREPRAFRAPGECFAMVYNEPRYHALVIAKSLRVDALAAAATAAKLQVQVWDPETDPERFEPYLPV